MGIMLLDSGEDPQILPPPSPPPLHTESNPIEQFDITGSTGKKYVLKRLKDNEGKLVLTCSCPSYQYCSYTCKTCKHIKQFLCAE